MSSPPALSLCALLACVIFCLTLTCSGHIPQTLCAARDALPGECRYGMYEDVCGKTVCLKGPGASCGQGMRNVYEGICSPGLTCTCDKCTGCSSITMECDKLDEFLCVVEKRITSQLS